MDSVQTQELLILLKALSEKSPDHIQYRENDMGVQVWATDNESRKHPYFVDVEGKEVNPTIDFMKAVCDSIGAFFVMYPNFRQSEHGTKHIDGWQARYGMLSHIDINPHFADIVDAPTRATMLYAATAATIQALKHHLGIQ